MSTTQPAKTTSGIGPRLPQAWLRAALAGIEAAIIGWLLVVVPTVAAYVATAAAPVLGDASWIDAATMGTAFWLLGHGGVMTIDGVGLTLMPLGLSLVALAIVYGAVRRARLTHLATGLFAVGGYVIAVLGISAIVPGGARRLGVLVGALLIGGAGMLLALRRARGEPVSLPGAGRLPSYVQRGMATAAWAAAGLLAVGFSVLVVALLRGITQILDLHEALGAGVLGLITVVLAQVAYLPTAAVWVVTWLSGIGFQAGAETHFSPFDVVTAPLPNIPLLGALPDPSHPGLGWVIVVPLVIGVLAGWRLHRIEAWWQAGLAGLIAGAGAGIVMAVLVLAGSGSLGPGRMADFGANPLLVGAAIAAEVACGACLILVVRHHQVHGACRRLVARARGVARGRGEEKDNAATTPTGESPSA